MPGMLPRIKLELGGNKTLVLRLPKKLADLSGGSHFALAPPAGGSGEGCCAHAAAVGAV